uniref:Cellular retinoic acid binding protein 1 n=1 Tax=Nothobranchius furzeri TaxID=105023 RepID=A0A8C6L9X8_NOTFU
MPNFAGNWKMKSSENFDELLKALGVNAMLRKVAVAAASYPQVEIRQSGEQFYIKTSTSVRTTEINFHIGEEFDEETVDGRKCKCERSTAPKRPACAEDKKSHSVEKPGAAETETVKMLRFAPAAPLAPVLMLSCILIPKPKTGSPDRLLNPSVSASPQEHPHTTLTSADSVT